MIDLVNPATVAVAGTVLGGGFLQYTVWRMGKGSKTEGPVHVDSMKLLNHNHHMEVAADPWDKPLTVFCRVDDCELVIYCFPDAEGINLYQFMTARRYDYSLSPGVIFIPCEECGNEKSLEFLLWSGDKAICYDCEWTLKEPCEVCDEKKCICDEVITVPVEQKYRQTVSVYSDNRLRPVASFVYDTEKMTRREYLTRKKYTNSTGPR